MPKQKGRVLTIKPGRDGYQVAVSNEVHALRFPGISYEDVIFDLEMQGYDVTRVRKERRRAK